MKFTHFEGTQQVDNNIKILSESEQKQSNFFNLVFSMMSWSISSCLCDLITS